jgi:hypothetical protein
LLTVLINSGSRLLLATAACSACQSLLVLARMM